MKGWQCSQCKYFLPRRFFSHTGGECPRCGAHIAPKWYTIGLETRPWSTPDPEDVDDVLRVMRLPFVNSAWEGTPLQMLNQQMGLELPRDSSKVYWPRFAEEAEYGPVDVDGQTARAVAGAVGTDELQNALLITCCANASAAGRTRVAGVQLANLLYQLATGWCVGNVVEQRAEHRIREEQCEFCSQRLAQSGWWGHGPMLLMDAVRFAFEIFDVPHTASVEYLKMHRGEPRIVPGL